MNRIMKNLYNLLLAVLLFSACDNTLKENLTIEQVYLVNSGEITVNLFRQQEKLAYQLPVYKSGLQENRADIHLEVNEKALNEFNSENKADYKLLPSDTYTILNKVVTLKKEEKAFYNIEVDIKKIEGLQGVGKVDYILPLSVFSDNVPVVSDKSTIYLKFEVIGGIRPGSGKVLWYRTLEELGVSQENSFTNSLALDEKYIYVNSRDENLKYLNRFNGEYVDEVELAFKSSLGNFSITGDNRGAILITNLRRGTSPADQFIYKVENHEAPELYIHSKHTYPNGRKIEIKGDLEKDALIISPVEMSSRFIYWEIKNGELISLQPKEVSLDENRIKWNYSAMITPYTNNIDDGIFAVCTGPLPGFSFFDFKNDKTYSYPLSNSSLDPSKGVAITSIATIIFNEVYYVAIGSVKNDESFNVKLLAIKDPSDIEKGDALVVFESDEYPCPKNTLGLTDVKFGVSSDKELLQMYTLGTNGGLLCIEFDCLEE